MFEITTKQTVQRLPFPRAFWGTCRRIRRSSWWLRPTRMYPGCWRTWSCRPPSRRSTPGWRRRECQSQGTSSAGRAPCSCAVECSRGTANRGQSIAHTTGSGQSVACSSAIMSHLCSYNGHSSGHSTDIGQSAVCSSASIPRLCSHNGQSTDHTTGSGQSAYFMSVLWVAEIK